MKLHKYYDDRLHKFFLQRSNFCYYLRKTLEADKRHLTIKQKKKKKKHFQTDTSRQNTGLDVILSIHRV